MFDRITREVRQAGENVVAGFHRNTGSGRGRMIAGAILIGIGSIFLLDRLNWFYWPHWLRLSEIWPVILVVIGIGMILGASIRSKS